MTVPGHTRRAPDPEPAVELWLIDEHSAGRLLETPEAARVLEHDEVARNPRPLRPTSRRARLATRLLCRSALSERTGMAPDALRFERNEFGRPLLAPNPHDVRFSIAHTQAMSACLVSSGLECGLDVERTPASSEVLAMAPKFVAPDELECLNAAAASERPTLFADYWALREAYSKAIGRGLTRPSDTFSFGWLPTLPIHVRDDELGPAHSARWRFALMHPGPGLVLAMAIEVDQGCRPVRVHTRRLDRALLGGDRHELRTNHLWRNA